MSKTWPLVLDCTEITNEGFNPWMCDVRVKKYNKTLDTSAGLIKVKIYCFMFELETSALIYEYRHSAHIIMVF